MPEAFQGQLSAVSLAGILQLAESEYICGWLQVGTGRLGLHNGAVTRADYGSLTGVAAAVEALIREGGEFRLETGNDAVGSPIATPMNLVLESCRVQDELDRLAGDVLVPVEGAPAPAADSPLAPFWKACDGARSVARLLHDEDLPVCGTVDALLGAMERGDMRRVAGTDDTAELLRRESSLTQASPPSEPAPRSEPARAPVADVEPAVAPMPEASPFEGMSFDDLMFLARKEVRRRDFDRAEDALMQALSLSPGSRIAVQNLNRVRSLRSAAQQ